MNEWLIVYLRAGQRFTGRPVSENDEIVAGVDEDGCQDQALSLEEAILFRRRIAQVPVEYIRGHLNW